LIRPSGKVCTVPGFDPESGVWLNLEPGVWSGFDGSVPCKAKAEAALGVLHVPLEEFSWKEPVDRSVALSAILTVLGRNLFDCAPLFVIAANTRGTGKSLLAEVITLIGTGTRASMLQLAAEEELNKAVHSLLMEAASVICIDNIDRPLNSAALCTALTQAVFTRRVLGVSRTSSPPTTGTTWLATGNNLTIEGDLTRRSLYCELDAGMERPEERRFSRDLIPWVREHRVELVQAGLTVLSAFLGRSDDEQVPSLSPFGGFDGWSRIVRGALMWLGEPDPCLTRDRTIDDDPEREDLHRLLRALVGVFGEARFQAKDLPGSGRGAGELATVLLEILGKDDCSNSRKLGKLLSKYKGRWVDGLRIAPAGKKQGVAVWMIERAPERADDERREETSWVS
jgi:hypothetical protein